MDTRKLTTGPRWAGSPAVACLLLVLAVAAGGLTAAEPAPLSPADAAREAHGVLVRLCDDIGGRLTGSPADRAALARLDAELRSRGLKPETVPFRMPGWERGRDEVTLLAPLARELRVAALAYSEPHPAFVAEVVDLKEGRVTDYPAESVRGFVGLYGPGTALQTREVLELARERGVAALLLINREGGGQLLARTGSFVGAPLPLPVYSIAQEEGGWIRRLLQRREPVRLRVQTRSRSKEVETGNLVLRFPGRTADRIILGAHVDSWDLGQGAIDNGIGIAQLLALARILQGRELNRTVELVWLNGEEQGLWGSRKHAGALGAAPVVAMVNLDMVGVPVGVNALGDETLVPFLERWNRGRGERALAQGVQNINWFGSDHTPYQLEGIRAITFNAPIPREQVRYYHDMADTIDKVPEALIVDSVEVIADLVLALDREASLAAWRRPREETPALFTRFGIDRRMRAVGFWPFP
jgi:Iap family predicted aminopeptidase